MTAYYTNNKDAVLVYDGVNRLANVMPIRSKDRKEVPGNYRPDSLT